MEKQGDCPLLFLISMYDTRYQSGIYCFCAGMLKLEGEGLFAKVRIKMKRAGGSGSQGLGTRRKKPVSLAGDD